MFRLSVLLCATIFVTLLVAGRDNGQMRPGLAAAIAAGEEIVVIERHEAEVTTVAPASEPVQIVAAAVGPVAAPEAAPVVQASYTPEAPAVQEDAPAPVFTLSALPTTVMEPAAAEPETARDAVPADGSVWYVTSSRVNVRQEPTTESAVVDRLTRGEAVTVNFTEGSEWAQVRIEGDGLEGYVALRLLSPTAP
jgi:hypothetical protein